MFSSFFFANTSAALFAWYFIWFAIECSSYGDLKISWKLIEKVQLFKPLYILNSWMSSVLRLENFFLILTLIFCGPLWFDALLGHFIEFFVLQKKSKSISLKKNFKKNIFFFIKKNITNIVLRNNPHIIHLLDQRSTVVYSSIYFN